MFKRGTNKILKREIIPTAAESVSQRRIEEDFMNAVRDGNTKRINDLVCSFFHLAERKLKENDIPFTGFTNRIKVF